LDALSLFPQAMLSLACGYENIALQAKPANSFLQKK
jgi:hypothetical protein